ncbi:hypothetical protein D7V91_07360 [bacterium 1xD42-67]|nr:hypothetical protein [Lawsonibacter sp.]RKI68615.1 hypothetical protein D7V91_07360 [bacterium 1xD42-67]
MLPPFDRLYEHVLESRELPRWLGSQKEIERYRRIVREIEAEETALLSALPDGARARFAHYIELRDAQNDLSGKSLFAQGAAMGIPLGLFSALSL